MEADSSQIRVFNADYAKRLVNKIKALLLWDVALTIVIILVVLEAVIYPQKVFL